jgi:sodium transport system ATP-binding protein
MISSVAVEARGLSKVYKGPKGTTTLAADGVSFSARGGEVFGLLGPNGAGKTTTLRMLSTVLTPTGGTALIAGHDVVREPDEVRASIGFLSGNTGLYPRLTPREVLRYFGRMYGMSGPPLDARIDKLAALLGMTDFLGKRCDALSSGMKQKVNIARTVLHDPPVLILDEPTLGLDVLTSRTIVDLVKDCRAQGKCVIFSTHIMGEVSRLCDRLAIVHKGKVQFSGTLPELRGRAGDDLEQAFISVLESVP